MPIVTIHQAKTSLSKLIEQAEHGEEVLIARGKKVVAKIVPINAAPKSRRLDLFKGKFTVPADFSQPLPDDELDAWGH
ncbi:MAG: type II toxin-antitoxin system Phd/YefM family antitoxin [Candidatus Korobacteraceae bacterium]|jgi:antitoxin (DNA-binding transcriptional repressor) of toxin-antitoxin stability system